MWLEHRTNERAERRADKSREDGGLEERRAVALGWSYLLTYLLRRGEP